MLKKKIAILILAFSIFTLTPNQVYATEIDGATQEETTTNVTTTAPTDTIQEETSNEAQTTTQEETTSPESEPETDENTNETSPSYGWLNISTTITDCKFEEELTISFKFTNLETNEEITKSLISSKTFSNVVKLPYGTYKVELIETKYEENIIYEKELKMTEKEQNFKLELKDINNTKTEEPTEEPKEKENKALSLLKNNFFFLILLIGCGGFLLYTELKKKN